MRSAVATRDLRNELAAIPGVSDAEISVSEDNRRTAKVWLDGTRDSDEVRDRIDSLLGRSVPAGPADGDAPEKRTGLGRGLETLLPDLPVEPVPAQLRAAEHAQGTSIADVAAIDRVAVVETHGSIVVEVTDDAGNTFTSTVDSGGIIDDAVLQAIRQLFEAADDAFIEVVDVVSGRSDLVIVEASKGDMRGVGAAHVEFGRPYAVAVAAHRALSSI
jgi:hypothetical protein